MREEVVTGNEKKYSLIGCLFRLVTVAVAVYGAVTVAKQIMTRLSKRLEEDNEGTEKKRFFTGLRNREICLEDETVSGVDVTVIAASVEVDLSDAVLSEETFVKIRTLGGNVVLKVPAMVRVVLDEKGVVCGFSNLVPNYEDESLPTIYVDAESVGACVKIKISD